jgi:hypothetical protein
MSILDGMIQECANVSDIRLGEPNVFDGLLIDELSQIPCKSFLVNPEDIDWSEVNITYH